MRTIENNPTWFFGSAIPKKLCEQIIQEGKQLKAVDGTVDRDASEAYRYPGLPSETFRDGKIAFFPEDYWIDRIIMSYVFSANMKAKWNFSIHGKEPVQFGIYNKHNFYSWHQDCGKNTRPNRKLSVTVQLSKPEEYEGGELQFLDLKEGNPLKQLYDFKIQGSVIVFPSILKHRVQPVTDGIRYSLIQWYHGPEFT